MKNFKAPILFTLLVISLSACALFGGNLEVFETGEMLQNNADVGTYTIGISEAPDGVYMLSENFSLNNSKFESNLALIDDTGVKKSAWLHNSESPSDTRTYYGVWYSEGKIITAYSPINLIGNSTENEPIQGYSPKDKEIDLIFDEYDEGLNLIRSVTAGKMFNAYTQSVAFDGEYFYYFSDNHDYSQYSGEPLADGIVYRLDRDYKLIDSEAPLGGEPRMASIERVITGSDGSVYILWHESNMLYPYLYRMKKYGEGEKTIRIQYNDSAQFIAAGDDDYLFYMYHQNEEILGVSETGKVTKIKVRDPDPMHFTNDFHSSVLIDGVRVSFSAVQNGENTDLVKKTIETR
jgi:hypothetical protein